MKKSTTQGRTALTRPRGEAFVDKNGNVLWRPTKTNAWKKAVYHNDIRRDLIEEAAKQGSYTFSRNTGENPEDVTSYHPGQDWSADIRSHRPPKTFQYLRTEETEPSDAVPVWVWNGSVVLDFDGIPQLAFKNLPATISSREDGCILEGMTREDPRIISKDLSARMPWAVFSGKLQPLVRPKAISMRRQRFRIAAGCISWNERQDTKYVKEFIDRVLPPRCKTENSTRSFRDLTLYERKQLELDRRGSRPERAGPRALKGADRRTADKKFHQSLRRAKERDNKKGPDNQDPQDEEAQDATAELSNEEQIPQDTEISGTSDTHSSSLSSYDSTPEPYEETAQQSSSQQTVSATLAEDPGHRRPVSDTLQYHKRQKVGRTASDFRKDDQAENLDFMTVGPDSGRFLHKHSGQVVRPNDLLVNSQTSLVSTQDSSSARRYGDRLNDLVVDPVNSAVRGRLGGFQNTQHSSMLRPPQDETPWQNTDYSVFTQESRAELSHQATGQQLPFGYTLNLEPNTTEPVSNRQTHGGAFSRAPWTSLQTQSFLDPSPEAFDWTRTGQIQPEGSVQETQPYNSGIEPSFFVDPANPFNHSESSHNLRQATRVDFREIVPSTPHQQHIVAQALKITERQLLRYIHALAGRQDDESTPVTMGLSYSQGYWQLQRFLEFVWGCTGRNDEAPALRAVGPWFNGFPVLARDQIYGGLEVTEGYVVWQ